MDRNSSTRLLLFLIIGFGLWYFLSGRKSGEHAQELAPQAFVDAPSFTPDAIDLKPGQPVPSAPSQGEICTIQGNRFEADLSTRGAGLTHFRLTDARYAGTAGGDVSTTPDIERWRNLRTGFREHPGEPAGQDDQVRYDRFDWKLERIGSGTGDAQRVTGCRFSYGDDRVKIVKTVTATGEPFELKVETTLTNLSDAPRSHATSVEAFAWRHNLEMKGKLGRVSPFQTSLECARGKDVDRKGKDDDVFKKEPYWFEEPLDDRYAAIENYYFAQALVPMEAAPGQSAEKPACGLLAEQWYGSGQKADDDEAGMVFHARLAYPRRTLAPHESATYTQTAFFGPKERDVLAAAVGGWPHLGDLINLGTFSPVAKVLVSIISWIHKHVTGGNWGLAIIVLTIGLRIALFPLTWKQIQSAISMRKLKPEIDALNEKFRDDPQAKNLAMMELWRKNKVNPLGGCLPALVQMPIWFALYATLQTAVEFYRTSFLWFADLSAPDRFYLLPLVLGGAMIVQQRIVPQQGMDPVQQKMMMWMMPGIFTVMMLFLPAALGVYMLTNSVLGITQQLAVEKLFPRVGTPVGSSGSDQKKSRDDIVVVSKNESEAARSAPLRKGKSRV